MTLIEMLRAPRVFDESWALFARRDALAPQAPCLVLEVDRYDPDDVPAAAREAGFDYLLGMDSVHDIERNLLAQRPDADDALRWAAFEHYFRRDAFIVLD